MNTDSYFEIGNTHTVCQDYALTGKINEHLSYAIVADGCSASPDVDVGARLVAHSAKEYLQTAYKEHTKLPVIKASELAVPIIVTATRHARDLLLPSPSLDSTLLIALSDGKRAICCVYGDGGFIVKHKTSSVSHVIFHQDIEFSSGAPYYLSYLLSPARYHSYCQQFEGEAVLQRQCIRDGKSVTSSITHRITDFDKLYDEAMFDEDWDLEWVALVSDGVKTYEKKQEDGSSEKISTETTIEDFINYKSCTGKFVERRMKRMRKDCEKNGITHYDDISIAAIYMGN